MDPQPLATLLRKLEGLGPLTSEERRLVMEAGVHVRDVGPDQDLVREGDRPGESLLLLEGFCCRYKTLPDGRRQILSFHITGDFLDLPGFLLSVVDHSVATLTPARVAILPHATVAEWAQHPNLAQLLWRDTLIDAATTREWVLNVGRRTAYQRVAHVLCELATRLQWVGLASNGAFDLPITQGELADATGLSTVHVNRVIQELRRARLIELRGRSFVTYDWEGLKLAAGFDPSYLHARFVPSLRGGRYREQQRAGADGNGSGSGAADQGEGLLPLGEGRISRGS
jgi:CRP-like cAMP-binding protein